MKIIGCDFHPSYQQIAMLDQETREWTERKLVHAGGDAQRFYESMPAHLLDLLLRGDRWGRENQPLHSRVGASPKSPLTESIRLQTG